MVTKEEREIKAKLKILKKGFDQNERLMREAATAYEDLLAQKETLQSSIEELRKCRAELKQQRALSSAAKIA
jgi:chromosome segregation ATPase